jgi:hypothetical protein
MQIYDTTFVCLRYSKKSHPFNDLNYTQNNHSDYFSINKA